MTATTPETCTPGWAHSTGVIDLRPLAGVPDPASIPDRMAVQDTAFRYVVAYDERRLDVIESLFTETVTFSYRVGEGPLSSETGRSTVIDWLGGIMQSQTDQRRHVLGTVLIESLTSDEALVLAYNTIFGVETEAQLITTGLYRFKMVKVEGNLWKIDEAIDALDRPF